MFEEIYSHYNIYYTSIMLAILKNLPIIADIRGEISKHIRCELCGDIAFTRIKRGIAHCAKCKDSRKLISDIEMFGRFLFARDIIDCPFLYVRREGPKVIFRVKKPERQDATILGNPNIQVVSNMNDYIDFSLEKKTARPFLRSLFESEEWIPTQLCGLAKLLMACKFLE